MRLTFDRYTVHAILDGKANRAVKLGPQPARRSVTLHKVGQSTSVGHVIIVEVAPATLGQVMPDGDVRAALSHGAPTTTEFRRRWLAHHDRHVKKLTPDELVSLTADEIADHWNNRWRDVACWALTIELDLTPRERFLAGTGRSDGVKLVDELGRPRRVDDTADAAIGYTGCAALSIDGVPAIERERQERYSAEANDHDANRRRTELYEIEKEILHRAGPADKRDVQVIQARLAKMRSRRAA